MRGSWNRKRVAALGFALSLMGGACSGDESVGPGEWTIDDLQGTWTITRYEYTSDANPGDNFDLIEEGTTGTIVVNGNGAYSLTFNTPGLPQPVVTNGTFTINGSGNVVDSEEGGTIDITRAGNTITIRDESATFDFDGDPDTAEENADVIIVWERQS